jgi:hypothetical protein
MPTETIDHTTLSRLAEAGAVRSAHVVGQAGGWGILVKYGMTERALAAQRSHQVRIFRKFETLVSYLKGVGIARFDVDTVNYDPASLATTRMRPDSAAKLKSAHEAAAYDQYFRDKVNSAINDTRPHLSAEDAHTHMEAVRAEIFKNSPVSAT